MGVKYTLTFEIGDDGYCETCSSTYAYLCIEKREGSKYVGSAHIRYDHDLPEIGEDGMLVLNLPELYERFNINHRQF